MKSSEPKSWKSYFKDNYVVGLFVQQQSGGHRGSKMKVSAPLVGKILPEMYEVQVEVAIGRDFLMKLFRRLRRILMLGVI